MHSINPKHLNEQDNYKLLIGSILPRPIALVTSLAVDETLNGAPFSFFNVVSSQPPIVAIAVQRQNGQQKHTAQNILTQKEFVIHIVDSNMVEQVNITAAAMPVNQSEISTAALTPVASQIIKTPGVKEAQIRFECNLYQHVALPNSDLMLGEVVCYHIADPIYQHGKIDYDQLKPVSRLAGNSYARIGEVFSIDRPQ
ncbi:NADH-FMN oxidoreductase RutF, flavin reductase (DIM6/NTAB) family [Amphibacillus marinus]|uniref:NADH-FMN oxidoreductase RutF, flavin reductase (DIM6/NTAB) family n=1 Tax=Amphibacillus marinus TaxID=872970 RepID=A0A1H8ILU7_9BACI|nr:flavin reductase family protein [Amphibacillus marinus]SEN68966.1 NADH-FMN oxidoreductase RutF, flavin reductase (DIM6/NTAB) family [Amphibacillus marinus]